MKRTALPLLAIGVAAAQAAAPSSLRYRAAVGEAGWTAPEGPVRVVLHAEILAACATDGSDLRLVDDAGAETPYVIYERRREADEAAAFAFAVRSFSASEGVDEVRLERLEAAGAYSRLEIDTPARDFRRTVEIATGESTDAFAPAATDAIFDFSSRIDLRKTWVAVPETRARFVRLRMQDESAPPPETPPLRLTYEGVDLAVGGARPAGPFRIDRVRGRLQDARPGGYVYDRVRRTPAVSTNEPGNTLLEFGALDLPVAELVLGIETPYYYRRVDVLFADGNANEKYRVAAGGVVYRIPGMSRAENTLRPGISRAPFLRVRIRNQDNPPLAISWTEVAWVRRCLCFVAAPGRRYDLYFGGSGMRRPSYETAELLSAARANAAGVAETVAGPMEWNPGYRGPPDCEGDRWARWQQRALSAAIVVVAAVLAALLWRVARSAPESGAGDGEGRE